ncbi:MAG: dihydrofolate reductase [Demequinaceae bacterium]|nr:dihydrofolate reductase [Demequinaceae bacterium]
MVMLALDPDVAHTERRAATRTYREFMPAPAPAPAPAPRTVAYLATSVDGFIAGPDDDLDWLSAPRTSGRPVAADDWAAREATGLGFEDFLARVGCLLMGRRTYDVVAGFDEPWPYGDVPVRVATTRPLTDARATVTAVDGEIGTLIADALAAASGKDVYVDGGTMVRAALAAGLLDDLVVTMLPVVLGTGVRLFEATVSPIDLTVVDVAKYGDGFVQVHYRCR